MKPFETLKVCGRDYQFKITTAYAVQLEEALGTDIISSMEKLTALGTLSKYLYYAAVSQNDDINKIEDIYQLIDDYIMDGGTTDELQKFVIDILYTSGILAKEAYDFSKKASAEAEKVMEEAFQKLSKVPT